MRYQVIVVLILLFSTKSWTQDGFKKTYSYQNAPYLEFSNILLVGKDTIVVSGQTRDVAGDNNHGIYLAKLDTLGNILDEHIIVPENDFFIHEAQYGIIKDSESGYAIVGQYFFKNNGVLIKVDDNFNVEYIKEFQEDTASILNVRYEGLIELNGHYFIMARKNHASDNRNHSHLIKVKKNGELIWDKNGEDDGQRVVFQINNHYAEDLIIIHGTKSYLNEPEKLPQKYLSMLDEDGNVMFYKERDKIDNERIDVNVAYFGEEEFIVAGAIIDYLEEPFFRYYVQPNIRKIDSQINQEWIIPYGNLVEGELVEFRDIDKCTDGHFISPLVYPSPSLDFDQQANILIKYNIEGEIIWERRDTLLNEGKGFRNQANRSIILNSGSIITCGTIYQNDTITAYLLKVDKNGCLAYDCPELLTGIEANPISESFAISLDPNPISGIVKLSANKRFDRVDVYNLDGILIKSQQANNLSLEIDLSVEKSGQYFLKIFRDNVYITKKLIKL